MVFIAHEEGVGDYSSEKSKSEVENYAPEFWVGFIDIIKDEQS